MQNAFKYIYIIGTLLSVIMVTVASASLIKMEKEYRISDEEFLSESEKVTKKKNIIILMIGMIMFLILLLGAFVMLLVIGTNGYIPRLILDLLKWLNILAVVFFVIAYILTKFYPRLYKKRPVIVFMIYTITILLGLIFSISSLFLL